jgi:hypothetical protein
MKDVRLLRRGPHPGAVDGHEREFLGHEVARERGDGQDHHDADQ